MNSDRCSLHYDVTYPFYKEMKKTQSKKEIGYLRDKRDRKDDTRKTTLRQQLSDAGEGPTVFWTKVFEERRFWRNKGSYKRQGCTDTRSDGVKVGCVLMAEVFLVYSVNVWVTLPLTTRTATTTTTAMRLLLTAPISTARAKNKNQDSQIPTPKVRSIYMHMTMKKRFHLFQRKQMDVNQV